MEQRQRWIGHINICVCIEDNGSCIVVFPHGILKEGVINLDVYLIFLGDLNG
jgi:hypothetical protein